MTSSEFDSFRPPEPPRRRGRGLGRGGKRKPRRGFGQGEGNREMSMVPDAEFTSYYGHPVVKPPPWDEKVAAYLFLGGVAGGSGVLAAGAQLTGRDELRRNARLGGLGAVGLGAIALVADLGRPDRFYNMLRTFKVTSPMSVGSWILSAFSGALGVAAVGEIDRMTGSRLPLGVLRPVLRAVEAPAGLAAAVAGPPLAVYTAVLLSDTAVPTWNAMHRDLPFVFVSSASLASSGLALVATRTSQAGPARTLAALGVVGDLTAMRVMESRMDPVTAEPLHDGKAGKLLRWSERLAVAGGVGALLSGRSRPVAVASGIALLAASACTRFGVFDAGIESAKNPRYTIEPQKRRLAARRAAGITDDSITTGPATEF
ncbi:NrfD/PsrC family molybdoenzyme membrane anchor subunit [Gordonia metallireducens]|uniref:NrfD/PsrC family molybdoenzyme membrane anchor subunit n=1 Tax=Gordonia metallireducens TaxID=2897779 RepID=UPI001E383AEF|nr:NrfD/PsrC family molybdoenzyme membrane anchor subunit [Gordonia metallireducens]